MRFSLQGCRVQTHFCHARRRPVFACVQVAFRVGQRHACPSARQARARAVVGRDVWHHQADWQARGAACRLRGLVQYRDLPAAQRQGPCHAGTDQAGTDDDAAARRGHPGASTATRTFERPARVKHGHDVQPRAGCLRVEWLESRIRPERGQAIGRCGWHGKLCPPLAATCQRFDGPLVTRQCAGGRKNLIRLKVLRIQHV